MKPTVLTVLHPKTKEPLQSLHIKNGEIIGFKSMNGWMWLEAAQDDLMRDIRIGKRAQKTAIDGMVSRGIMEKIVIEVKKQRFKMTFIRPVLEKLLGEKE